MEPADDTPPAKPAALKDRIADLRAVAGGAGERLTARMKALQASAPGAAADLKARLDKLGLDRINRESIKAGRDVLAARVEAMLKPRAADDVPSRPPATASLDVDPGTDRADIAALKAKLDAALKPKDAAGVTVRPAAAQAGMVARIADALPKRDWTIPFTRSKRTPADAKPDRPVVAKPMLDTTAPMVVTVEQLPTSRPQTSRTATSRRQRPGTDRVVARGKPRRVTLSVAMLATALVTGAVLHIVTTFAIPLINAGSAFDRIKFQLDVNAMKILQPDVTGAMPLPFLSPDMRYAFCRYDITSGPVAVSAVLPEAGWSLALYTPQGDNFYAVPGQDGRAVDVVFNISPASDRLLIPVPGQRRADVDAAQVTSPTREGLVVIRAPNKGAASVPMTEAALRRAACRAVERR
jgi:uncharacterized membrane protein